VDGPRKQDDLRNMKSSVAPSELNKSRRPWMRCFTTIGVAVMLAGCVTGYVYKEPESVSATVDTKVVESSLETTMRTVATELGRRSFSIESIDRESGLINVSYNGDPEKYVDCGLIWASVRDGQGKRSYKFPAAKAQQTYEARVKDGPEVIDRSMHLASRATLIFEEIATNRTKVTTVARYVLVQRQSMTTSVAGVARHSATNTYQFNSGSKGQAATHADHTLQDGLSATFPWRSYDPMSCVPTGLLESDILSAVQ
jgi:head-tail adaptor